MYKAGKRKKTHKKRGGILFRPAFLIIVAVLVLGGFGAGLYAYSQNRNDNIEHPESEVADPGFSDGTPREPAERNERNGDVEDTSGEATNPEQSGHDPIVSDSGKLKVYMPQPGQVLQSGDTISGEVTAERVWYRLMDNRIGILTQGSLTVENGRFSGVFNFETDASKGRLDVFTTTDDGVEQNNVSIDINFK